jgi:hypothetical protein
VIKDGQTAIHLSTSELQSSEPASPLKTASIERVGLVCYLSHKAIERADARMAVFPSGSMFGATSDDVSARPSPSNKCSATDHLVIAPDRSDHIHWHVREATYALNVYCNSLGIQLNPTSLSHILDGARIVDKSGKWHQTTAADFPPLELYLANGVDNNLDQLRGELQWFIEHCEQSNLRVQRGKLKRDRAMIKKTPLKHASEICGAIMSFMVSASAEAQPAEVCDIGKLLSICWDTDTQSVGHNHLVSSMV